MSSPSSGIVITSDTILHYGVLLLILLGIMVITYFLVTRCKTYWIRRIKDWANNNKDD